MKNLSNEEINLLRQNARSIVRELGLLNDAYFEVGVTLAERHLLIELTSSPRSTAGEIAERLLIDKSTVSRLIAKAAKKGYIQTTSDKEDKRKRFIEVTELGKKTLNAFEPIAFHQTKEALLTLTPEEVEQVHRGIALYAKGLKNARLQRNEEAPQLLNQLGYSLERYSEKDENALYEIFRKAVDSGSQFPYESNTIEEFRRQFLTPPSRVYVCHSSNREVVGGFYIKPNFPGGSDQIANAAYMVSETHRGEGIGTLLVKASLHLAKEFGFQAMQFNRVLIQNTIATQLYQKLGFNIIGNILQAIRNRDGSYQEARIMHRNL